VAAKADGLDLHGADILDGHWRINTDSHGRSAPNGIASEPMYVTARPGSGESLPLRRHGERFYSAYDPHTLESTGPLLSPDSQGGLYRTIPVKAYEQHGVFEPSVLNALDGAPVRVDGVIALGQKYYAKLVY
jgi:hypothetical protein